MHRGQRLLILVSILLPFLSSGCFTYLLHLEASVADSDYRVKVVDDVVGTSPRAGVYEFVVQGGGERKTLHWVVKEDRRRGRRGRRGHQRTSTRWGNERPGKGEPVPIFTKHPNNGAPYFLRFPHRPRFLAYHDATGRQVKEVDLVEWSYDDPIGVHTVLACLATPFSFSLDVLTSPFQLAVLLIVGSAF